MSENYPIKLEKIKRILINLGILKILLIASFVFWGLILYFNPYSFADLEKHYTDHMRHEYASWLFLNVGFKVFNTPIGVLSSQVPSLNPHPTWPMHPSIYPLGNILYFIPFGILSNLGIINDITVHKLMILSFLTGAHLAVYYFVKELKRIGYNFRLFLMILLTSIFYTHIVFWSLNGFYDVVAILLIILSIKYYKEGSSLKSIVILTGSFFLHYRSIFYLPLWICLFVKILLQYKDNIWSQFTHFNKVSLSFLWFISVASLDFYTVYLSFVDKKLVIPIEWQSSIINIYNGRVDAQILLITFSAMIFFILLKRKSYITVSTMLLCLFYVLLTPQWVLWHHLFFFPALLLPSNQPSVEIASFWLLISVYLTAGIISPLWISHLLQKMFQ